MISRTDQQGTVIIAVMVVMALLMVMASTLVNHFANTEAEAVEETLLEAQVYWAMMGHANYMLSRAKASGTCWSGGSRTSDNTLAFCSSSDDDYAEGFQDYLDGTDEIQTGNITTPGPRRWVYPQQLNRLPDTAPIPLYNFEVTGTVKDARTTGGESRHFRIDFEVSTESNAGILQDIAFKIPSLTVRFCVTDSEGTAASGSTAAVYRNAGCTMDPKAPNPLLNPNSYEGDVGIEYLIRSAPDVLRVDP